MTSHALLVLRIPLTKPRGAGLAAEPEKNRSEPAPVFAVTESCVAVVFSGQACRAVACLGLL